MSDYTKILDWAAKDTYPTGDSRKIIRGSEFDSEFGAISTAIATKLDKSGGTVTGTSSFNNLTVTGVLDVSSGTFTLANDQISGDKVHGGTISNFASTGINDDATLSTIVIDSENKVGIGIADPALKLDVEGSMRLEADADIFCNTSGNGSLTLTAGRTTDSGGSIVLRGSTNSTNPYGLEFRTNSAERMSISSSGIVKGIWNNNGTSNASSQIMKLTQAQYDAIGTKDSNTLYIIVG